MNKTVTIRHARPQDVPAMEEICIKTAPQNQCDTEKRRKNILYLYNRYYTRAELENCFVAANEQDRAVGYILCAGDYTAYKKGFFHNEFKQIAKLGFFKAVAARGEVLFLKPFARRYPAHLHIDILPEYQGNGVGTRLMQALICRLKEKQTGGVMLCVAASNTGAVSFYRKQGFTEIKKLPGSIVFGMAL